MHHRPGKRVSRVPVGREPGWQRWASVLIQVVGGAVMLAWTWRTWPDVLIDFGRELYVPWRLVHGAALYRDLAYFNGPLSPTLNALWFWLLGSSLRTLEVCNLVLLVCLLLLMQRLLLVISDRLAATIAGLVFLLLFAFAQYVGIGNYNYICPYSHELTHGLLLSLAALYALYRFQQNPSRTWVAALGLTLGLALLTKPEVFAAAGGALAIGLALTLYKSNIRGARLWHLMVVLLASFVTPPCVSFLLLLRSNSPAAALWGTLGGWQWVFNREIVALQFYRRILGTDDAPGHLLTMIGYAVPLAMAVLAMMGGALLLRRAGRYRLAGACGMAAVGTALLLLFQSDIQWQELPAALPVILAIACVLLAVKVLRLARSDPRGPQAILALTFVLFSLLLLAKMALNVHLYHYGFALAMPGTMIVVVALLAWLPRWLQRRGAAGFAFRITALTALGVFAYFHLAQMSLMLERKTVWVGSGPDRFRADLRAKLVAPALELLERRIGPDQTLAVLPEGVMLNFLARRTNPTPFSAFLPVELIMFGEPRIVQAFERSPPDFVALVHADTSEYGYRFFGQDYGRQLRAWIDAHYRPVKLLGGTPLTDQGPGVLLLQRRRSLH
jgi:hypothetical protein